MILFKVKSKVKYSFSLWENEKFGGRNVALADLLNGRRQKPTQMGRHSPVGGLTISAT